MIDYQYKTLVYGAYITYCQRYVSYSPGVILNAEIIRTLFGTHYEGYDYLGFQKADEKNSLKKKGSTGSRETITVIVNKRSDGTFHAGNQIENIVTKFCELTCEPSKRECSPTNDVFNTF